MSNCTQEVEDTVKELNEKKICGVLVRALSSHASAEDRANYYECFQLNKNIRNAKMKNFFDKMIGLMHLLNDHFFTISEF